MSNLLEPFSVNGQYVSVVPLTHRHNDDLVEATADGDLHKLWYTSVLDAAGMSAEIDRRLSLPKNTPLHYCFERLSNVSN